MNAERLGWYVNRFRGMSAAEVGWRCSDQARKVAWRRLQMGSEGIQSASRRRRGPPSSVRVGSRHFESTLPLAALEQVPPDVRDRLIEAADQLLDGRWEILGVERKDMGDPDWFFDPVTGRRAPEHDYSLGIDSRSETVSGNVKQVWELSRLHHLTVLAAAFSLSGERRYAERVADHLRSWWAKNRFLSGIHWTSGIELGIRLISFVWIRRLLDAWDGVESLFDDNPDARVQIWWHQRFLAGFPSRGSSANNHVIAEAAGQLIASLAFPWFPESRGLGGPCLRRCWKRSSGGTPSRAVSTVSWRATTTAGDRAGTARGRRGRPGRPSSERGNATAPMRDARRCGLHRRRTSWWAAPRGQRRRTSPVAGRSRREPLGEPPRPGWLDLRHPRVVAGGRGGHEERPGVRAGRPPPSCRTPEPAQIALR